MLTRKQLELLNFIKARLDAEGIPPSFDEMKEALDLRSKSGIHRLITALEERGFIRRLPHRARALEILKMPEMAAKPAPATKKSAKAVPTEVQPILKEIVAANAMELPVMGRIAAGVPIEAISEVSHHVVIPGSMLTTRANHYALEVNGDSMIEAGINDGDLVVIREQDTAENGDIIVALIEESEATLKRFRRKGSQITLEAANPSYENRVLPDHKVRVQGRLVGLIRNY